MKNGTTNSTTQDEAALTILAIVEIRHAADGSKKAFELGPISRLSQNRQTMLIIVCSMFKQLLQVSHWVVYYLKPLHASSSNNIQKRPFHTSI